MRNAEFDKAKNSGHHSQTKVGTRLASSRCDVRAPLTYPGRIQVATIITDIERKQFKMKYVVYSEKLNKVAAEGEGLIVYYDYQRERSCEIPKSILSSINALQHNFE